VTQSYPAGVRAWIKKRGGLTGKLTDFRVVKRAEKEGRTCRDWGRTKGPWPGALCKQPYAAWATIPVYVTRY